MKKLTVMIALALLAGCSKAAEPEAAPTETGSAAEAKTTPKPSETPMTAERCIEEYKGSGTGTRSENTKECLLDACAGGDSKACKMTKSFSDDGAEEDEDGGFAEDATAK